MDNLDYLGHKVLFHFLNSKIFHYCFKFIGPRGDPGQAGFRGVPGRVGATGPTGSLGPIGQPGANGQPGQPGLAGQPGAIGSDGLSGNPGFIGEPGSNGLPGDTGTPGNPGEQGEFSLIIYMFFLVRRVQSRLNKGKTVKARFDTGKSLGKNDELHWLLVSNCFYEKKTRNIFSDLDIRSFHFSKFNEHSFSLNIRLFSHAEPSPGTVLFLSAIKFLLQKSFKSLPKSLLYTL